MTSGSPALDANEGDAGRLTAILALAADAAGPPPDAMPTPPATRRSEAARAVRKIVDLVTAARPSIDGQVHAKKHRARPPGVRTTTEHGVGQLSACSELGPFGPCSRVVGGGRGAHDARSGPSGPSGARCE